MTVFHCNQKSLNGNNIINDHCVDDATNGKITYNSSADIQWQP